MRFLTFTLLLTIGFVHGEGEVKAKILKKKTIGIKRAIDSYAYPTPNVGFDDKSNVKAKVIVETIKSISPPEYLPPPGYASGASESSIEGLQVPSGSVSFNAFEPDSGKKTTAAQSAPTVTTAPAKKKPGGLGTYRYYGGSGAGSSIATSAPSSTLSPAPVRTTSVEPATSSSAGYQYTSRPVSTAQAATVTVTEKAVKIGGSKAKGNGYSYTPKIVKKPTRLEPKAADSKPEETGFTGYHYDVGSGYEAPIKHSGPAPGMMGLSFMRSSSPYYNYHVMLD